MKKGSKKKICDCCGKTLMVPQDMQWMTLHKECYIKYYLPFKHKGSVSSFSGLWGMLKAQVDNQEKNDASASGRNMGLLYGRTSSEGDWWD